LKSVNVRQLKNNPSDALRMAREAPVQRMFRDVRSASAHIHFSVDMPMTQWGLVTLGGKFKSPTL
jgi:hypothetical protein